MNRFGNEIHGLTNAAVNDLLCGNEVSIDTALGLMTCGVDPRDIVEVESQMVHDEDNQQHEECEEEATHG